LLFTKSERTTKLFFESDNQREPNIDSDVGAVVFLGRNTTIDRWQSIDVGVCPKIVGDTDVTVVADVTIGCYRMYF
jgi:hypothetical protein